MWQKRSEMARKQYVSAIKGALIFLLIPMLVAALLPAISLAKPVSIEPLRQAIIPATTDPTANLPSVADAQVRDWGGYRDTNYGTSTGMRVGHDLDAGTYRSFVLFDLSSIPSELTIISASFNAYVSQASGPVTIEVYRVLSSWDEHTVTWNNQPSPSWGESEVTVTYDDKGKWVSWDVTELVRGWLRGIPNYGLGLWGTTGDWASFNTRETAYTPYLLIDYTGPPITPPPDNTPPEVSITCYPPSPSVVDEVNFTATASDPGSGIAWIRLFVGSDLPLDVPMRECESSPCTYYGGPYPEGTVIFYYAQAQDGVHNQGETDIQSFTVGPEPDRTPPEVNVSHSPRRPNTEDPITFTAEAEDPSDIDRIEIYVYVSQTESSTVCERENVSTCSCTVGPYPEIYAYAARAWDGAGNEGWDIKYLWTTPCDTGILPSSFDWRDLCVVTPIRSQGHCGSCWAYSALGAVECKYNIEQFLRAPYPGILIGPDLSEQELVLNCQCGCKGGWPHWAFEYIEIFGGILDEGCFPYQSENCLDSEDNCREICTCEYCICSNPCDFYVCMDYLDRIWKVQGHWKVDPGGSHSRRVRAIKESLICHGPLSVASMNWRHALVLVGYDDDSNVCRNRYGENGCWILKNSWGVSTGWWNATDGTRVWGEFGFAFIPYSGHRYSDVIDYVYGVGGITAP